MNIKLFQLAKTDYRKKEKRIGRGNASGKGTYSTKGAKGQRARSGGRKGLKIKSLKSMIKSFPKLSGFQSRYKKMEIISLDSLNKFLDGSSVGPKELFDQNIISSPKSIIKVLNNGVLTKKINLKTHGCSAKAKESIEKVGGSVEIIEE